MKTVSLLFIILIMSVSTILQAEPTSLEKQAYTYYANKQYPEAISLFQELAAKAPDNAAYYHMLAKSYGREAEQVNWFKAVGYAGKTRDNLKKAMILDSQNIDILTDMMDYYRQAPGFLGGDRKKAAEIEQKIEQIRENNKPAQTITVN